MVQAYVRITNWLGERTARWVAAARRSGGRIRGRRFGAIAASELGQTTAEYALVILAAAAVALVLIAWARSSGKLPDFFNKIIDNITNSAQ
jgi:Protein of unknown function (DUF4244)